MFLTDLTLNSIPTILNGYIIIITANIVRSLDIKKQNKKRNFAIYKSISNEQESNYKAIYAKLDKESVKKLNEIFKESNYPKELTEIINKFKNYVTPENFITCLKNLKTISFTKVNFYEDLEKYIKNLLNVKIAAGRYNTPNNEIEIFFNQKYVLSHEFLHMSSTIDKYNCGFQVYTKFNKTLGIGINEGYTELLNHRIFNSKSIAYYHNVKIAKLIETFFESENEMESAYFHSDIETLI